MVTKNMKNSNILNKNDKSANVKNNNVKPPMDKKKILFVTGGVIVLVALIVILFVSLKGPLAGKAIGDTFTMNGCAVINEAGVYTIDMISDFSGAVDGNCITVESEAVTVECSQPFIGPGSDVNNLPDVITAIRVRNVQTVGDGDVLISGCEISNFLNGIIIEGSSGAESPIIVTENNLNNVFTGINVVGNENSVGSSEILVDNNDIEAEAFGITVSSGSNNNVFSRNDVFDARTGISVFANAGSGNYFVRNVVTGSTETAFTNDATGTIPANADANPELENEFGGVSGSGLETYTCVGLLDNGASIEENQDALGSIPEDSLGYNLLNKGFSRIMEGQSISYNGPIESCTNGNTLLESYCVSGSGEFSDVNAAVAGLIREETVNCGSDGNTCQGGRCVSIPGDEVEVCSGGSDEDGDGAIDCLDADCIRDASCTELGEGLLCINDVMCASGDCENFVCTENIECGNGVTEGDEVCDGNSQACSVGGSDGTQTCNSACDGFDACIPDASLCGGVTCGPTQSCVNNVCAESAGLLGDTNGNGVVTQGDAILILRSLLPTPIGPPLSAESQSRANVNSCRPGGESLTNGDAIIILRSLLPTPIVTPNVNLESPTLGFQCNG
jgi:hypothetical protein